MSKPLSVRSYSQTWTLLVIFGACHLWSVGRVGATVFDWDNFGNNSNFNDAVNWLPGGGPPGTGDTAIFDGQLQGQGIGNNTVNVTGSTSRWTVTEDLVVGYEDSTVGRLNVTAGLMC